MTINVPMNPHHVASPQNTDQGHSDWHTYTFGRTGAADDPVQIPKSLVDEGSSDDEESSDDESEPETATITP